MGNASFKILPGNKLIIEKFTGIFKLAEYIKMKKEEFSHSDFDSNFNVLADIRETVYGMKTDTPDEPIMSVTEYLKSNKEKIGRRKCAFLAINPDQVVSSIFYSNFIEGLPIISKSFTTLNAALDWLAIKDKKEILDYLK